MKKWVLAGMLVLMVLFSGSCTYMLQSQDGHLGYYPMSTGTRVGSFTEEEEQWFLLSPYLYNFSEPNKSVDLMVRRGLMTSGGDFAKDLRVGTGYTVFDFVISYFVPVVGRHMIYVEGDAYRF